MYAHGHAVAARGGKRLFQYFPDRITRVGWDLRDVGGDFDTGCGGFARQQLDGQQVVRVDGLIDGRKRMEAVRTHRPDSKTEVDFGAGAESDAHRHSLVYGNCPGRVCLFPRA
jgi:hypothetical protein